jgi:hypothetical protein
LSRKRSKEPPSFLQGWQAGALAVFVALAATLLVVPWAAAPNELPLPVASAARVDAVLALDRARAAAIGPPLEREIARGTGGPLYDLRAFGEALRAYGRAEAEHAREDTTERLFELRAAFASARTLGDDKVLELRAYQTERFLAAVREWEARGAAAPDLAELGGPFLQMIARQRWVDGRRRIGLSTALRSILFRRRWNEIVGANVEPFALSLDENRLLFAHLLTHPVAEDARSPEQACRSADAWRLRKIGELAKVDRAYPYALARGVLLYRLGRYAESAQALHDHIASAPDGPYALRARNWHVAAIARAGAP